MPASSVPARGEQVADLAQLRRGRPEVVQQRADVLPAPGGALVRAR